MSQQQRKPQNSFKKVQLTNRNLFPKIHNEKIVQQKKNFLDIQIQRDEKLYSHRVAVKQKENKQIFQPSYSLISLKNYKNYELFQQKKDNADEIEKHMKLLFKRKQILDQNFNDKIIKHNQLSSINRFNSQQIEKIMKRQSYSPQQTSQQLLQQQQESLSPEEGSQLMNDNSIEYMLSRKRQDDSVQIAQHQLFKGINLDHHKALDNDSSRIILENNIIIYKITSKMLKYCDQQEKVSYENMERRVQQKEFDKKNSVEQFQYLMEVTSKIINSDYSTKRTETTDILDENTFQQQQQQQQKDKNKDFIFLIGLKEFFEYFKQQDNEIINRLLLCLDINPYNDLSKVYWWQFNLFKRIIIERSGQWIDKIKLLIQFIMGQKVTREHQEVEVEQLIRVCRLLFRRAGEETVAIRLAECVQQNIQLSGLGRQVITVANIKQLFLHKYLMIEDFITLFHC